MFNDLCISGRLTADPVLKTTDSGKSVTTFTLAVDKAGAGGSSGFFPCVAWDKAAELIERYFSKGKYIDIQGTLQQRSYTDKNSVKRSVVEIICRKVGFGGVTKAQAEQQATEPATADSAAVEDDGLLSDELPF